MKSCPQCGSQYSDDTLSFCLQDGTPLAGARAADTPTAVLSDEEATRVRASAASGPGAWRPSEVTRVQSFEQPAPRAGSGLAVVLAIVGTLAVLGVLGVIGLLIWQNSGRPVVSNISPNANLPGNTSTPISTPIATGTPNSNVFTATPTPNSNSSTTTATPSASVNDRVIAWKSQLESRNLSAYMAFYAPTVDYYTKSGVNSSAVRADKERAFNAFTSMQVSISNLSYNVSPDGNTANATFDKEWVFSGSKTSSGKVRSRLDFKNIDGQWLITGEHDVKVYYTR